MMSKSLLLITLFLFATTVLAGPHGLHGHALAHRAIGHRSVASLTRPSKRGSSKRCRPRPTSSTGQVKSVHTPPPSKAEDPPKEDPKPTPKDPEPAPKPKPNPKPDPPKEQDPPKSGGSGLTGRFAGTLTGDGTFYNTGLTACGVVNNDNQFIAAVSHELFDTFPGYKGGNPNNNPICGRKVRAHRGGNSVVVSITDRCAGCSKFGALDFSPIAFKQLADPSVGRFSDLTWEFL